MNFKYLFLLIPFFFISCDKDEEALSNQNNLSSIEQKIINFKSQLTSNSKEELTYSFEEAEWNLEALLNYEEANNEHNYHNLQFVHEMYQVSLVNGEISNTDLLSAYNYFLNKIDAITKDETVFSDLVNISIVEPEAKDGEVNIVMNYSCGSSVLLFNYNQFNVDEDWIWGNNLGPCGNNSSTEMTDASNRLQQKLNNPIVTGPAGYFTGVDMDIRLPHDYPTDPSNPSYPAREHIMYWGFDQNQCIPWNELNFYLNKFDFIKADVVPTNKTFKSVEVKDDNAQSQYNLYCHDYFIYFGDFHQNAGGGTY